MAFSRRVLNLAMSGGGVKGIAYIGVFDVAEKRGYRWGNIAGVSAGALAGAFAGAGYSSYEMWKLMETFDFQGAQMENIQKRVPVVAWCMEYLRSLRHDGEKAIVEFLSRKPGKGMSAVEKDRYDPEDYRSNILSNIITYSKYGCLFDGDYLEEWVYDALARRGIRTFGDLRNGKQDPVNPKGYKVRMTGVDCNRGKLVVMPDDMAFYGIDPDDFEVAKAVRISTCVPFAFKPVEIKKTENGKTKTYHLVDGGVFDRFPYWLVDSTLRPAVGFKLSGGEKKKFFSIDTALDVLKSLISAVQDIGIPEDVEKKALKYVGEINTTKVHYLDFNLSDEEIRYLYNAGRQTAIHLFNKFERQETALRWLFAGLTFPLTRKRTF